MPSKILELRRKVSGSFNHNDSLSYVRTNWSGIDGKPSVYPPAGHQHLISQVTNLQSTLDGKALKEDSLYYISGTGSTAGTWLGSHSRISEYYDGLTIAYKIPIAGASTTTLNINGLGARTVRRNASNLTTHLPVNTVVVLTYTTISSTGYWVWADYDSTRSLITQAAIDTGTETTSRSINALILRNNFYLKSETDTLLAGKAASDHAHTWGQITGKPSWIGSSKPTYNWSDIQSKPIISVSGTTTGTNTDPKAVTENMLKAVIEAVSPSGSRPSNDVAAWAKSGNSSVLPAAKVGSNSSLESSDKFLTNAQTFKYVSKSDVGLANVPNIDATNPANITQSANYRFVTDSEKTTWSNKQNALGFTPVPDTRTIAGLNLTANRTRDQIIGVSANGYIRRTGANTYDTRTVANLKSDLSLNNVPNVDATNPANISQTASYRFVTDSEKNAWNNKWKQIYSGTSAALSKTGFTSISVPSDSYAGKTIAVEIRYGSNSDTSYTNKIVFVTLGTNGTSTASKTYPRYITLSDFDGQFLKNISTKCYVTTGTASSISFGRIRTLIGSFSGTTIDWTTHDIDDTSVYIGKIWVLE